MKLLLDNNLSYRLCLPLQPYFAEVKHVGIELSNDAPDAHIWAYAKQNDFHILTKDNDFDDWSILKGCPPKVIHLMCGNQTTLFILNLIIANAL